MLLKRKLNEPCDCITNMIDPYVTGGKAVMSLYASLPQKISAAMDHLCQIALNQKLLHKLEKLCKFSNRIKVKSRTRRPACIHSATD